MQPHTCHEAHAARAQERSYALGLGATFVVGFKDQDIHWDGPAAEGLVRLTACVANALYARAGQSVAYAKEAREGAAAISPIH